MKAPLKYDPLTDEEIKNLTEMLHKEYEHSAKETGVSLYVLNQLLSTIKDREDTINNLEADLSDQLPKYGEI